MPQTQRTDAARAGSARFSGHSTATTSVEVKSIFAGDRSGFDFLFKGVFSFEASAEPGEPAEERLRFERRPVKGRAASSPAEGSGDPFAAAMADSQDASRPSSGSARMASHRPHPCRSVPTSRPRSSRGDHQGAAYRSALRGSSLQGVRRATRRHRAPRGDRRVLHGVDQRLHQLKAGDVFVSTLENIFGEQRLHRRASGWPYHPRRGQPRARPLLVQSTPRPEGKGTRPTRACGPT